MERGKKRLFADAMLRLLWFPNCLNVRRNFTLSLHSKWCNSPCFLASFPFPIILTFHFMHFKKFKSNALHLWWLCVAFCPFQKWKTKKNGRAIIPLRWNMNAENHPSSRLYFDAVKRRSFLCATAAVENGSSLDETVFDFLIFQLSSCRLNWLNFQFLSSLQMKRATMTRVSVRKTRIIVSRCTRRSTWSRWNWWVAENSHWHEIIIWLTANFLSSPPCRSPTTRHDTHHPLRYLSQRPTTTTRSTSPHLPLCRVKFHYIPYFCKIK